MERKDNKGSKGRGHSYDKEFFEHLPPQQLAVLLAVLTEVLQVKAVILDVNQNVEVILTGNLKSKQVSRLLNQMDDLHLDAWIRMIHKFK